MSLNDITKQLAQTYGGQAAAAAETTAGKQKILDADVGVGRVHRLHAAAVHGEAGRLDDEGCGLGGQEPDHRRAARRRDRRPRGSRRSYQRRDGGL